MPHEKGKESVNERQTQSHLSTAPEGRAAQQHIVDARPHLRRGQHHCQEQLPAERLHQAAEADRSQRGGRSRCENANDATARAEQMLLWIEQAVTQRKAERERTIQRGGLQFQGRTRACSRTRESTCTRNSTAICSSA